MNKEEILEKSRQENKNLDLQEKEVVRHGALLGYMIGGLFAVAVFFLQLAIDGSKNYALFVVANVATAVTFTVKAVKLKRRHEAVLAVLYWLLAAFFGVIHICNLLFAGDVE